MLSASSRRSTDSLRSSLKPILHVFHRHIAEASGNPFGVHALLRLDKKPPCGPKGFGISHQLAQSTARANHRIILAALERPSINRLQARDKLWTSISGKFKTDVRQSDC